MIGRSKNIQEILNKIAVKQKQLEESKDFFKIRLLKKELRDLRKILSVLSNEI